MPNSKFVVLTRTGLGSQLEIAKAKAKTKWPQLIAINKITRDIPNCFSSRIDHFFLLCYSSQKVSLFDNMMPFFKSRNILGHICTILFGRL
jgi:hypothetical protein